MTASSGKVKPTASLGLTLSVDAAPVVRVDADTALVLAGSADGQPLQSSVRLQLGPPVVAAHQRHHARRTLRPQLTLTPRHQNTRALAGAATLYHIVQHFETLLVERGEQGPHGSLATPLGHRLRRAVHFMASGGESQQPLNPLLLMIR